MRTCDFCGERVDSNDLYSTATVNCLIDTMDETNNPWSLRTRMIIDVCPHHRETLARRCNDFIVNLEKELNK